MHAIVDGLEAADIAGVKKEDVKAALTDYEEAVAVVQDFYVSADNLRMTMADGIDGINIAVNESAQGVAIAAQSTSALVGALENIKEEADSNLEISENLQGEVNRFKNI